MDARKKQRKGIHYSGRIVTGEGADLDSTIFCRVENVSEHGAKIAISMAQVPDEFLLMFAPAVQRKCAVIWRSSHYLGVKFI